MRRRRFGATAITAPQQQQLSYYNGPHRIPLLVLCTINELSLMRLFSFSPPRYNTGATIPTEHFDNGSSVNCII